MKTPWRMLNACFVTLAVAAVPWMQVFAAGATGQQEALQAVQVRQAPLVLSGNGDWRLHVGPDDILHRVSLRHEQLAQRFQLPLKARILSASRSGQRVAFTSDSSCVGLVDFGSNEAAMPTLRWLPSGPAVAPDQSVDASDLKVSGLPADHECGGQLDSMDRAIALSADGRRLATAWHVINVDTRRVVATLNVMGSYVLDLAFLPDGKKLMIASAVLGDRWESAAEPSRQQFSVWNLDSGALERLNSLDHVGFGVPQEFFQSYSSATGLLYRVDAQRHWHAGAMDPPKYGIPLDLMQTPVGACKPVWRSVFPVEAWKWPSMVVDPLGRWVAGIRSVAQVAKVGAPRGAAKTVEWLEVFDMDTQKMIAQRAFQHSVYGLVALSDGSAILGLTGQALDQSGQPFSDKKGDAGAGELIRLDIPMRTLTTAEQVPQPWQGSCLVEDEVEGARHIQRQDQKLRLLWTTSVPEPENLCDYNRKVYSFVMPDQTLWANEGGEIKQLDALTGRVLKRLPAPHKPQACHLPLPPSGGFVSYEGDTLVWRGLESGRNAAQRKVVDRRPGWFVGQVRWDSAAGALLVYWDAKPEMLPLKDPNWEFKDRKIAYLNPQSLAKVSESETTNTASDMVDDGDPPAYAACERASGPQTSGVDWRLSHFDSFRAYACGPAAGQTRTVFWSEIDIQPKPGGDGEERVRRAWVEAEGVAVAQNGKRLKVIDIGDRRELAHLESAHFDRDRLVAVHLLPQKSLVLVETSDSTEWDKPKRRLSMYSYR